MMRTVTPIDSDRLDTVSDATWEIVKKRGEFFEADTGHTLLELGQTNDHLLIILAGQATLVYFQDGQAQPTAIYRVKGEVLHHAGMHLKMVNPFRIDAASDQTRVVLLQREVVYQIIAQDANFAEYLFKDLSERFMVALSYLREQRQEPLIIRLAKRILTITKHRPSVEFTQAELAEILAVTRISISKAIKTLEEQGLIRRAERGLILVDREKLQSWLKAEDSSEA
ncbi:MAG: Crp/Fnr family transcriptional regulator [Pseudomonadota bacterium]